ncbi:hypothetical protein NCS56_00793000 [Fusarium sp. Ph1]|nr:hypothetical protein NCS56_00793000 [Fusarium sp. Ph1]
MGRLDMPISNAGWTKFAGLYDLNQNVDEAVWDSANVKFHFCILHVARGYPQNAKGAFVMASSVAGVKSSGSSINWIAEISQERINEVKGKKLLKTLTDVGDVAEQVVLLARSGSVTGTNVVLDAGFSV